MRLIRFLVASALSLSLGVSASAQDPAAQPPDPSGAAGQAMLHGALQLSLEDAIAMGLKNNLDVEVARYDPLMSWENFRAAYGAYDPQLFADFGYFSRQTPVASSLQANSILLERELGGQSGLQGKVPWLNAIYTVGYVGSSLETNSSIQELSPEYRAGLFAEVQVPLLRNLIWDQDWTRVKQTKIVYDISNEEFRRQVMDTVNAIEGSYWNLVAAEEQERVAEKSVQTATALLDQTKIQYEVGVVSRVEVTEAEAGLAQREVAVIRADNVHLTAQDVLMNQVLGPGLRAGSRLEIVPTDRPDDYIIYEIDEEAATSKAFENRPELAAALREIERRAIEVKYRNNQKLPQLDLVGHVGENGLAGKPGEPVDFGTGSRAVLQAVNAGVVAPLAGIGLPVAPLPVPPAPGPPIVPRSYGATDDDFLSSSGARTWWAQGVFSIPLGNRTARHLASLAEIDLRKAGSEVARLKQQIILDVRLASRNLVSAQQGIEAAERARVAADEQLRAERIRLEQGESTPFDVLLREENLVSAESIKIDAIRIYRNSIVALDRQQGTILQTRNIVVDDILPLR